MFLFSISHNHNKYTVLEKFIMFIYYIFFTFWKNPLCFGKYSIRLSNENITILQNYKTIDTRRSREEAVRREDSHRLAVFTTGCRLWRNSYGERDTTAIIRPLPTANRLRLLNNPTWLATRTNPNRTTCGTWLFSFSFSSSSVF